MNPFFNGTPKISQITVAASVTALTSQTGWVSICTGTTSGTTIVGVYIKGAGNTTAGAMRFALYNGTRTDVIDEVAVDAITVSGTTASYARLWAPPLPLVLQANSVLQAAPFNAEQFGLFVSRGDFS